MSGKVRMYRRRDVKAYRDRLAAERAEEESDWREVIDRLSGTRAARRVDSALRGCADA